MKRIIALLCVILFAFSLVACGSGDPETNYNKALECLEKGEYEKAHRLLYELGDYKDAKDYLSKFRIYYKKYTVKNYAGSATLDFEYDSYGNLILSDEIEYIGGGGINVIENCFSCEYEYDASGKITKCTYPKGDVTVYIYDAEGKVEKYEIYDASGNFVKEHDYASDSSTIKQERDEDGNLVKETEYDSEGNEISTTEYTYDSNKRVIKRVQRDTEGNESVETLEYNEAGRVTKYVDNAFHTTDIFVYNSENVLTECTEYEENGALRSKHEFDDAENMTKATYYDSDGSVKGVDEYEYDSFGKITKIIDYNSDGTVNSKEEYKYDENGNLVKEVSTIRGSTVTYTYSDFVYFYYPDGIPEVTGNNPYNYDYIFHFNLGDLPFNYYNAILSEYINK